MQNLYRQNSSIRLVLIKTKRWDSSTAATQRPCRVGRLGIDLLMSALSKSAGLDNVGLLGIDLDANIIQE